MKTFKIVAILILLIYMSGCRPGNIVLSPERKKDITSLVVYIPDIPDPKASVAYIRDVMAKTLIFYYDVKAESKIEASMEKSDFKSLLLDSFQKNKAAAAGITITIPDGSLHTPSLKSTDNSARNKRPLPDEIKKVLSPAPYVLIITIHYWGYDFNSSGFICNYYVDMTAEIIHMATDTLVWRRAYAEHDYGTFKPETCDFTRADVKKDLTWIAGKITQDIIKDLNATGHKYDAEISIL